MDQDFNTNKIDDLLKKVLKKNNLDKGVLELDVKSAWKEVMGIGVWNYTSNLSFKNDCLKVHLKSSTLREELSFGQEKIIQLLNEHLKKDCIKKIILH